MKKRELGLCQQCLEPALVDKNRICMKCYKKNYYQKRKEDAKTITPASEYNYMPSKKVITVWETTDGNEYNSEVEALRHQLDINFTTRRNRG